MIKWQDKINIHRKEAKRLKLIETTDLLNTLRNKRSIINNR